MPRNVKATNKSGCCRGKIFSYTTLTHLTLKMTSAQVVETSVTNNSSFQNYTHPDDHTIRTTDTPGFKLFTKVLYSTEQKREMRMNFIKSYSSFSQMLSRIIGLTFVTIFFKQSAVCLPNFDITIQSTNSSSIHVVPEANYTG